MSDKQPQVVTTYYNTVFSTGPNPDVVDESKQYKRYVVTRGFDRKGNPCNDGPYIEYYNAPGEKVKKKGSFSAGRIDGELLEFYEDGITLSSKSQWRDGSMVYLQEFDKEGKVIKHLNGDF
jgi:antitoxin component YwqK of YwqJK toxin-antitoxin module